MPLCFITVDFLTTVPAYCAENGEKGWLKAELAIQDDTVRQLPGIWLKMLPN
jgi:hypothetical protein